jgi:1,4-dihydroxy-2-naphthoyl-CoA hydrolase
MSGGPLDPPGVPAEGAPSDAPRLPAQAGRGDAPGISGAGSPLEAVGPPAEDAPRDAVLPAERAPWDASSLPTPLIPVERTFEGFLGLEWVELTPSSAHVRFHVRENLLQPLGLLHGGIYCAVAESVASVATVNAVWREGKVGSGLNNSASFLRPVTTGPVDVTARLRGHDDREWFWGHEFHDQQGRLCALVDVTIAVRALPARDGGAGSAGTGRRLA